MSLANRQRPHDQHHQRTLEQQMLDALLRIEELLIAQQALLQKPEVAPVEGNTEDVIKDIEPTNTPFMKSIAKKTTGARKVDRL